MIKSIVFDVGGVLMADVPLRKIAEELSLRFSMCDEELHSYLYPTEHWTLLTLGKISEDEYWDHFLKASQVDLDKGELKEKVRMALRPIADNVELIPQLKDKYELAILSNHAKEWSQFMIKEFDFFRHFHHIIFSCDVGLRKPDPQIYKLAMTKLGCEAEECLFIDDKQRNTDGAQKVGMKTIVLENASRLREELFNFGVVLGGISHVKKQK
jgi:epoxide hydrolase-like predicted phosphatase